MQAFSNKKPVHPLPKSEESRDHESVSLKLEEWLPYRLFLISARVADVLSSYYEPKFGLSRAGWRTMAIVANRPGISVKEICQAGGLDQFSVSRAIRQLVELGFAQRQTGRSDKRYAAIELSNAGWNVFLEISDLSHRIDAELMAFILPEEREILDHVLGKLDNASAGLLARGWHRLTASLETPPKPKKKPRKQK